MPKMPPRPANILRAMVPIKDGNGCVTGWGIRFVQAPDNLVVGGEGNSALVPMWNEETSCVESWAVKIVQVEA